MDGIIFLKALLFLYLTSLARAATTACPSLTSHYTGTGGANYDICASTNYEGASDEVVANITSALACAELCDQKGTCLIAVYDDTGNNCDIKSDNTDALNLTTSTQYTTIYFNNTLPELTDISSCPYNETTLTTTSGTSYKTCVDTDIRGASAQRTNDVNSTEACLDLCINYSTAGCTRAVYDKERSVCHIKADAASNTMIWYTNKRYDVIQQEVTRNPAVVGSWSEIVRFPVIPVAAYIVPAFPQPSRMLVFSSWGATAFGGASGYTQFADYNFET